MPESARFDEPGITAPLQEAIAQAEELIRNAPFIRTEQDLLEGYDYLAGRIRAAIQGSFDRDLENPVVINGTHQFARQGLDNPDAIYLFVYLDPTARYVLHGNRGTSADLSFQVMGGGYTADGAPQSLAAFDDRELDVAADGSYTWEFGPLPGAKNLIVREVFSDWDNETRGTLWVERVDRQGVAKSPLQRDRLARSYEVAASTLVGSIQTWFEFPKWFTYKEPVNTLTAPQSTPGGLASQFSSIGHYELADDEALVVTVPKCADCAYQAIQIGSDWYLSTDYETHQTSLTGAQTQWDDDGYARFVISEQNPGVPNWLEALNHRTGMMMLRWQRTTRPLTTADGPKIEKVAFADLATTVPYFNDNQITAAEYSDRIAARQRGVAKRMLS